MREVLAYTIGKPISAFTSVSDYIQLEVEGGHVFSFFAPVKVFNSRDEDLVGKEIVDIRCAEELKIFLSCGAIISVDIESPEVNTPEAMVFLPKGGRHVVL